MARTTVPAPPDPLADRKNVNIHLTPDFRDDLTLLMSTGRSYTDVIRTAVRDTADAYRRAWDMGDVPPDTAPVIRVHYSGELVPAHQTPVGGSGA
jgi:hypothetical protein